jgi:hypothetical protein
MAEPQPAAAAEHQPGVQDGLLGVVAVGQRQRSELGGGQLPARGREHLDQVARRAGQRPGRRADRGPQVLRRSVAACSQRPGAGHRQQRVTVRGADHLLDGGLGQVRHAAGHRRHLGLRQRAELDLGDFHAAAGQVGQQRISGGALRLVAAGQHEQHGAGGQPPADVRAQLHAGRVGPVYVLGDQEHGPAGGGPLHQPQHRVENPEPLQFWRGHRRWRLIPAQPRGDVRGQPAQFRRPVGLLWRRWHGAGQLRCQLLPYGQRRFTADVDPGTDRGSRAGVVGAAGQLRDQAGLADSGLSGDQDHASVPGARGRPGRHQRPQFRGAPE